MQKIMPLRIKIKTALVLPALWSASPRVVVLVVNYLKTVSRRKMRKRRKQVASHPSRKEKPLPQKM
ncbi:hypothetical protein D9M68_814250 [compost metagenome]